jgi:hypothetical protein
MEICKADVPIEGSFFWFANADRFCHEAANLRHFGPQRFIFEWKINDILTNQARL